MKCEEIKEYLYEYHTLRLTQRLFLEVDDHLKTCGQCQQELKELEETINLLNRAKPPEVAKDFKDKIMDRVGIDLIPANKKPHDTVMLNLSPNASEKYKDYIAARDKVSEKTEPKVIPFYKKKPYRFALQGVIAAMVVLAVATTIKLASQPSREAVTRGVRQGIITKDACAEAIQLYNEGTLSRDLALKEKLLSDALSQRCEDKKIQAKIHNNLADCFESQGKIDTAIEEYKKAIEIDPELATAYISIGDIHKKKSEIGEAIKFYEKGIRLITSKLLNEDISSDEITLYKEELENAKIELEKIKTLSK